MTTTNVCDSSFAIFVSFFFSSLRFVVSVATLACRVRIAGICLNCVFVCSLLATASCVRIVWIGICAIIVCSYTYYLLPRRASVKTTTTTPHHHCRRRRETMKSLNYTNEHM